MIGDKLVNRYQIIERVGGGGMAVVYKARCTLLNRIVAVKVLRPQYASDEEFVRRFRREAQAVASLSHPNIVGIYDVGQDKDTYFIVMEFIEGETLKELIRREAPLDSARAVTIARQIANALYHAHSNKIIHRDIKPHNVMLAKDGRIKVTDFGIARATTNATQTFSQDSILGSVHYFSPEQARGKTATEQSDLYSLGIILYEMLTGRVPFDGESPVSIALKHLQETITPISRLNTQVPRRLMDIVGKLLQKDRNQRYSNALDLIQDLRTWNADIPVVVETIPEKVSEEFEGETQVFTPLILEKDERREKIRRYVKLGSLVLGSLLLVTLLFFGIRAVRGFFQVQEVSVPDLLGKSLEEATQELEALGLQLEVQRQVFHDVVQENHVISQDLRANTMVRKGRTVRVSLSRGPDLVEVPDVTGMEQRAATNELNRLGFQVNVETEHSDEPVNTVIRQVPAGGRVRRSETITIVISTGPRPTDMVNLVGRTLAEAEEILVQMELELQVVWLSARGESPGGIVEQHSPAAGEDIRPDDRVQLRVRPFNRNVAAIRDLDLDSDQSHSVRIEVDDITGSRTVYNNTVTGSAAANFSYEAVIWERGSYRVYVNGALVRQGEY